MRLLLGLAVLLLLIVPAGLIRADGKFLSQASVTPVAIPSQAAVIHFAEGRQTLTIWNTVRTDAPETAWVLPLPAAPDIIQKTSPNAFRLLDMIFAPEVRMRRKLHFMENPAITVAAPSAIMGLVLLMLRRGEQTPVRGCLSVWLTLLFSLTMMFLFVTGSSTTFGIPPAGPSAGVSILDSRDVGAYETQVVSAQTPEDLNSWLASSGYAPFSGSSQKAVEDYIARKWVFLCARMKLEADSPVHSPHPLTVRFPAKEAVYPMQLTAGSGDSVNVRLFVYGEWHEFPRDASGRLQPVADLSPVQIMQLRKRWDFWQKDLSVRKQQAELHASGKGPVPLQPDLLFETLFSGDGTALSLLTGNFGSSSDWSDIHFIKDEVRKNHTPHASADALLSDRVSLGLTAGAFGLFLLAATYRSRTESGKRPSQPFGLRIILPPLIACAVLILYPWNERDTVVVPASTISSVTETGDEAERLYSEWSASVREREADLRGTLLQKSGEDQPASR